MSTTIQRSASRGSTTHGSTLLSSETYENCSEKNEILRLATSRLAAKGHISTNYPPKWMPMGTWLDKLPTVLSIFFGILFVALLTWLTIHGKEQSGNIVGVLAVFYAVTVIYVSICFSLQYPIEYVEKLNFRAIQLLTVGAAVNLVFGHSNFVEVGINEDLGSFFGTTLLIIGTITFSFCTFILGPWQFMVGSPLLAVGLLLQACATYVGLYDVTTKELVTNLNLLACPFLFIALAFVGTKSYQLMRLPVLGNHNFRFFGIVFYGGSIMANAVLAIIQGTGSGIPDKTYRFIIGITNSLAFFGTSIFLLDGSRVKNHCNARLEDRYPSTTYILRLKNGFAVTNICSCSAFVANFINVIINLRIRGKASASHDYATAVSEVVCSILTSLAVILFCLFALYPSLKEALHLKEKIIMRMMTQLIVGFFIFAIGNISSGILKFLMAYYGPSESMATGLICTRLTMIAGAFGLVVANWPLDGTPSKVCLHRLYTWENMFHPCNYVLLSSIWLLIGAVLSIASFWALASLSFAWAFFVILLHCNMAYYVWESMNLQANDHDGALPKRTSEQQTPVVVTDQPHTKSDVLICGGGVSGLFLACILGKQNVKVTLCERRTDSVSDARFAVLNSASVEHVQDVLDPDIFEKLIARALPQSTHYGSMILSGLGHEKARSISAANSPPRDVLMETLEDIDDWTESRTMGSRYASQLPIRVMQSHQEEILKIQLARLPTVQLLNGWKLENFRVDEDTGVISTLVEVNADEDGKAAITSIAGRREIVLSSYIVGCDGPSSTVAKKLGFKFDGLMNLAKTKSLLAKAPGLYERVVNTVGNTHQYQVIRKNFGLAAVVAADPDQDLWNFLFLFGDKVKNATPEKLCEEFLGTTNFTIVQNRQWYWNFFIARSFRQGKRAFLCGDSAHSWPPFGGLGGNVAYGDAVNLGWKLALGCKGKASELLLESYSIERRQQVLQTALYVLRATPDPRIMKFLTSRAFYNRLYMPIMKAGWYHHNSGKHASNHFAQSGIQFGVKYNFSPTILRQEIILPDDPSCDYNPSFASGSRLPHLPFPNGESTFTALNSSGYTVFLVNADAVEIANTISKSIETRCLPATVVIIPNINPESYKGNKRPVAELLKKEDILVVRPDHIIAWNINESTSMSSNKQIEDGVSKITGLDGNKNCLRDQYKVTRDAEMTECYQQWLTREFLYNQRPYKFRFPNAIPINNLTKQNSILLAKSIMKSGNDFSTSTKQGDEKYEKLGDSQNIVSVKPSGFEIKGAIEVTPMPKLINLAKERELSGHPVYNFAVGNPSLEPPQTVLSEMGTLISSTMKGDKSGVFKYTPPAGLLSLRTHLAKEVGDWQLKPNLSPENIVLTPGAQSAIVNIFQALLQPGDQVLTQSPFYPAYSITAKLWNAETKCINFIGSEFDVDISHLEELASNCGNKLRLIALCSPANPSGQILREDTLTRICNVAKCHSEKYGRDVWIVMDCTYWRITFGDMTVPPIFPLYRESLLISSFSKDLSVCGERLGYAVVNPDANHAYDLVRWIANNNDKLGNLSPPSLIQHTLCAIYDKHGSLPNLASIYEERVEVMHKKLNKIGLSCPKPEGTFYLLPRMPESIGTDDKLFAVKLAHSGVLCVPGSFFGSPGCIRLAVLPPLNEINNAIDILKRVINSYELSIECEDSASFKELKQVFFGN